MKKIIVLLISIFILSNMGAFAEDCAKEGQTYNNGMDAQGPFACCSGLKGFTGWNIDGQFMPLCYNTAKETPVCMKIGTIKGRYYSNGTLLKSDSSCEIVSNENLDTAISWMHNNDLTIYNNTNDFKANNGLRRDEAAKFFVQFTKLIGNNEYIKTKSECEFSDINQSWSDLKNIVIESCRMGLFQGSKGRFYPKDQLTNAQAITVLIRLIDGFKNEKGLSHRSDNYYDKANELGILQNVSMNNKNNITTRGNVGIIIYNGKDKKSSCLNEGDIEYQNTSSTQCCGELSRFEYRRPSASSTPMCYDDSKGTPLCQQVGTSSEGRYYSNGTLLKKDNECSEFTL